MAGNWSNWLSLKSGDVISGALGTCYATIDGSVEAMLYVKNIEAKIEKNKSEIPVLGWLGTKHKTVGWTGTGSMTIYYATTKYREMTLKYIKDGVDTYFDMTIENEDPTSSVGKQTILLKKVNFDNMIIAKLDVEKTELDEDMDFTFEDVDILNSFAPLVGE